MKKFCILLIVAIVFGVLYIPVSAETSQVKSSGGEILKQMSMESSEECESVDNTEQIEAIWKCKHITNVMSASKNYSKYYGGSYINDDDQAVVLLTNYDEDILSYCIKAIGYENIVYEQCNISFQELNDLKEYIINFRESYLSVEDEEIEDLRDSIVAVGIYEDRNEVFVQMTDCSNEKIDLFKKCIVDSKYVVFEESDEYKNNDSAVLKAGECILIRSNGEYSAYSIGFRCRKLLSNGTYIYGFVTSGHGCSSNDKVYNQNCEEIGYIYKMSYYDGGKVDAAFVRLTNSGYSCSNSILENSGALATATCVGTYTTGATVYKAGWVTELTTGKIVATNVSTYDNKNGVTIKDCVKATYDACEGDSGGLVYMIISSNAKAIAGIHRGSSSNYTYFVKQQNIRDVLGVILY